jgi:hypothetical protein
MVTRPATMCNSWKTVAGMFNVLTAWIDTRREVRRRWQVDARRLIGTDERGAYYAAQRLAARHRVRRDSAILALGEGRLRGRSAFSCCGNAPRYRRGLIDEESQRFHAASNPDV